MSYQISLMHLVLFSAYIYLINNFMLMWAKQFLGLWECNKLKEQYTLCGNHENNDTTKSLI